VEVKQSGARDDENFNCSGTVQSYLIRASNLTSSFANHRLELSPRELPNVLDAREAVVLALDNERSNAT
jgi:hypothetical protein